MTEQEIKEACKFVIEHGQRDFTEAEKELLKAAVDQSRNFQELFAVVIASLGMGKEKPASGWGSNRRGAERC